MDIASIGFRAKTGKAIAVALVLKDSRPSYLARWEVSLCDSQVPETGQPHHAVMELPWSEVGRAVAPIEARIETIAAERLSVLLTQNEAMGRRVRGVGVVGSPDRPLERIGNRHMRAHAAEGILFRRVLEIAASRHNLQCRSFSDRDFELFAASELGQTLSQLQHVMACIGQSAGRPWRADERAAAMAAWLMLRRMTFPPR
jgi:hypothetical protein